MYYTTGAQCPLCLQQHYTSSQQLVQQLQVSVVTMVTRLLALPTPSWQAAQEEANSECSKEQYHHLVEECSLVTPAVYY